MRERARPTVARVAVLLTVWGAGARAEEIAWSPADQPEPSLQEKIKVRRILGQSWLRA